MSDTTVTISFGVESLVPDVRQVAMIPGNTVTFRNTADIGATLFANSVTKGVLIPAIGPGGVTLAAGAGVAFGFAPSRRDNYAVLIQIEGLPEPPETPCTLPVSNDLIITDAKAGWPADGGQDTGTKTANLKA